MSADDLIASLCAEGRVDSHGGFTLDRAKAREKLRTFQVAEPHRYVLHLVALAALRGATAIEFEIDSDDLWARFDGAPLTEQDFEDLYSSNFAAATTDAERARQQLAVGLNAALALNPRHVRVTSGPPGQRVLLEATHGAEDVIARVPGDRGAGTVIHVKQRFRPGLVVRFFKHVLGDMPEATVLRERAVFARIPVRVEGLTLGAGEALTGVVQHRRELRDGAGRVCVAGLRPEPHAEAEVRLVRHGVWISTLRPKHLPGGTVALVHDDSLQTDLSGQEVVHNEARERCLRLVELAMEASLLDYLVDRGHSDPWLRARLVRSWLGWPRVRDPATPLGMAMAALPWWSDIFGAPVSLAMLRTCLERQPAVYYTAAEFADRLEALPETVVAVSARPSGGPSDDLLILKELFGERLRDRTRDLEREVRRSARRRLWRMRPAAPQLEPAGYSALAPIRIETPVRALVGQVGLRRERGGPSTVRVIVDGHLLCELNVELPLPVDAVVAGIEADDDYEAPLRDDRFALALLAVLDAGLGLVEADMSQQTVHEIDAVARALARRYLQLRYDPEGPRRWLQGFGFRSADAEGGLRQPTVAALVRVCRARAEVPTASLLEPWLAECERLPTACGRSLSLGALALALARGERVVWIGAMNPGLARLDRIVLRLDAAGQDLITQVFGDRIAQLTSAELQALLAEQRFMSLAEEDTAQAIGPCGATVRVEDGPLQAVLGVSYFRDGEPLRASVRVLVRGRKLTQRALWAPFKGVVAVVRDDRLTPTVDWDAVVVNAAWRAAERALLQALPRLAAEAARVPELAVVGDVLAASFPSQTLRRAWERLVEFEGPEAGEASYELLLGLASQVRIERLDEVLDKALRQPARLVGDRRVHPIANIAKIADDAGWRLDPARTREVAAVLKELRILCGQHRPGLPLAQQVLASDGPLVHEWTFRRVDGATVTLAALIAARARGGTIEVVTKGLDLGGVTRPHALVVDDAEADRLARLFGPHAVRRVYPAVKVAQLRAPTLPAAPDDALARVFVRGSDVAGVLWMPAGAEEEDCRVGLHRDDGTLIRRVSLLPPLPLAGALTGEGVRIEGFRIALSLSALAAVRDAALRLYDDILGVGDPATQLALRRISGRIGDARLPPPLEPLRERLRAAVRAGEVEAPPSGAVQDVLADMFVELEAAAREQGEAAASARDEPSSPPMPPDFGEGVLADRLGEPSASPPGFAHVQDVLADLLAEHTGRREPTNPVASPGGRAASGPATSSSPPGPPEMRLLTAIRTELRALREQHERLLSNFNLEHLRLAALGPRAEPVTIGTEAVVLNKSHALIRRAAAEFERDPWWIDVLASLVFTAFNVWREEITDADEQTFHRLHLERVARRSSTRP
ncbi:hypothetical protein [Nannocystis radixulma]|uniref:Uncharacterized protein n=1 Tax=Nannocystis radixulma TaxID=2995305 RepID=A0ABT5BD71_9BACT|nr:hypothetical protein [Nannocystis radixulma]MDC0671575.1 hypothetical protein [Nannocystis radixulma]